VETGIGRKVKGTLLIETGIAQQLVASLTQAPSDN